MADENRSLWGVCQSTSREFLDDDCLTQGAATAFYTMFSLPPLLIVIILLVGLVVGKQAAQSQVESQLSTLMGPQALHQIRVMAENQGSFRIGLISSIVSLAVLVFGATGVMVQLQSALNRIWKVEPDPRQGGVRNFIFQRILSFGMVLAIAFVLLVSLVVSALLSAFGDYVGSLLPDGFSGLVLRVVNQLLSLAVFTVLFAAMFRVLPDAKNRWRDLWVGALLTAVLFTLGKWLISLYLGSANVGSAYGAAGSLAVILIWVYYSSLILFLGAEFTQVWSRTYGGAIPPANGAVRTVHRKEYLSGA